MPWAGSCCRRRVWARGTPNRPKDGISPLDGIIETDWLPFTFTMNWQFTRPCRIAFERDEPFCFLTLLSYRALEAVQPEIKPIASDPELAAQYEAWRAARVEFNKRLTENDAEASRQGWQKFYVRGSDNPSGAVPSAAHTTKVKLADPVRLMSADAVDGSVGIGVSVPEDGSQT
jgi:hypothetical protein